MSKLDYQKIFRFEAGSIFLILFGAVLLLNPDLGSAAVAAVLGWVLIGGGVVGLLIGFLSWPGLGIGELMGSGLLLASGIYLLNRPLMLAKLLGVLLGILLLAQGIGDVRDGLRVRQYGGAFRFHLITGVAMTALGAYLILSPLATSRFVWTVAGLVMVACGITNLVSHRKADKFITQAKETIIDAEE